MLVKKVNHDWVPKENNELQVGDTIEITDPKALILNGDVVAIDEATGATISAYELYGVVVDQEFDEFKAYQQQKQQERQATKLQQEQEELQAKIKAQIASEGASVEGSSSEPTPTTEPIKLETATEEATQGAAKTATEANTTEVDVDSLSWKEMTELGKEKGVFKVGMTKPDLITAIKAA